MSTVIVAGSLDDLKSRTMRFLEEASKLGDLHVLLFSDEAVEKTEGRPPKFPLAERQYFVESIKYVDELTVSDESAEKDSLPKELLTAEMTWVVDQAGDTAEKRALCQSAGINYAVIEESRLAGYPPEPTEIAPSTRKKVIVTGCYDWFHTGHVRFFEEVSELGDLYVVVGHDDNIKLLKGEGHPMFPAAERRYMADSIRFVNQALVSSGSGWLDAEPEIERIKPDIYAVNEDGDVPEKRNFCETAGIAYRVLKRTPKEGLLKRESTDLRGF